VSVGLEGSCSSRQIIMPDINNLNMLADGSINSSVDIADNLLVVLRNVVLNVDND
jgi:hypothetical protein